MQTVCLEKWVLGVGVSVVVCRGVAGSDVGKDNTPKTFVWATQTLQGSLPRMNREANTGRGFRH